MKHYLLSGLAVAFILYSAIALMGAEAAKYDALIRVIPVALNAPAHYRHSDALQRFYKQRNHRPLWLDENGQWQRKPEAFITAISRAAEEGLNPQDYPLQQLVDSKPHFANPVDAAVYELAVTDIAMDYIAALRYGRVNPQSVFPSFFIPDTNRDLAYPLQQIADAWNSEEAIYAQAPSVADYARLREALAQYRALAAQGDVSGDLHKRIVQIILAMERWRWLPRDLGDKYVLVNTAGYYAIAVENDRIHVNTPVIVGQVAHPTPSFSSYITNVKFYPDWSVPSSITKRYILKQIREGGWNGYELYDGNGKKIPLTPEVVGQLKEEYFPPYRLRQKPGVHNALGLARFSVENDYSIYLHDTPKSALFAENNRNFSSGCVRVADPVRLAQFLLVGNSPLSAEEIVDKFTIKRQNVLKTDIIPLATKIPVHIIYMTAWIGEDGNVHFADDAYGHDATLKAAMGL